MWPQILLIALYCIVFTVHSIKDGEPRGNYSVWGVLVGIALNVSILYFGGFWNPIVN